MKKLFIIFFGLILSVNIFSQEIRDRENFIEFYQSTFESVGIGKSTIAKIVDDGQYVYLYGIPAQNQNNLVLLIRVSPSDYGWTSSRLLRNYLFGITWKVYSATYNYNASSLVDTITYNSTDSLAYRTVFTYDGSGNITNKSEPINE